MHSEAEIKKVTLKPTLQVLESSSVEPW